jgi:DNA repair protein RecO (recombination protein O)
MRIKAFVIKKQPTGEYDEIISVYTREFGKLIVTAKSVLKPDSIQAMHLDVLNLINFEMINGRGMPIVASANSEKSFPNIKKSLPALAVAGFFAEVIDKLAPENDRDDNLWNFISDFLDKIEIFAAQAPEATDEFKLIFRNGQKEFLKIMGYYPELNNCVLCSAPKSPSGRWAVDLLLGGLVCEKCFLAGRDGVLLTGLHLDTSPKNNSEDIIDSAFEFSAGQRINSLNFVRSVLKLN